jgi:hypothetical protein
MVKVKMRSDFSSSSAYWREGDVIDVPAGRAARMIERGLAAPVREEPIETVPSPSATAERAVVRRSPRKSKAKADVGSD